MFTGIIEEIGRLKNIETRGPSARLTISCSKVLSDVKLGDSIAVNGICLTVTTFTPGQSGHFTADVMNETIKRTAFSSLRVGSIVNLERAMIADGRFGGHIVSGHIDGTGRIKAVEKHGNATWYTITPPANLLKYIVEKGSIAIDGTSLTVAYVDRDKFKVSIIPHTSEQTILSSKKPGDLVNLEVDVIGKYVEKMLERK
ncbi:riboflavin synthase [Eubacteriales bacterium KG127]